jgi:hypothetical protein
METSMKYILPAAVAIAAFSLAACERQHTSSTVIKEPTTASAPEVVKEKETIVQAPAQPSTSSTTIVNPPAPNVTIDASKPETTTERSKSTTTVDTPMGTATTTETSKTVSQ